MRYLALATLLASLSCSDKPLDTLTLPDNPLLATAHPGAIVLSSHVDAPIGFLIHAQSSMLEVRWPPCYSNVSVQISSVLGPGAALTVPAAAISGYRVGDSAAIYYKVLRRDNRITSRSFYFCVREGRIVLVLR